MTRVQAGAENPTGRPPSADIDHPAPDFVLNSPDGEEIALSDFRGQPIVLNFWATWCPPCRAEVPALQAAGIAFDNEAVILGVSVQESASAVNPFLDEYGVTYPIVLDQVGDIGQTYRVRAFPTTYFIDETGVVVDIYGGPMSEPLLHDRLTSLIGE